MSAALTKPRLVLILWSIAAFSLGTCECHAAEDRIDGDLWAKRNVELIRRELSRQTEDKSVDRPTVLSFSIQFNPLLLRDPYAAEVAGLAEAYLARAGKNADFIRRVVALLRKPPAERTGMGRDEFADALEPKQSRPDQKPEEEEGPPDPGSIAEKFLRLPIGGRAAREPAMIDAMEAAARSSGKWGRLVDGHLRLARAATDAGDRARADRHVDRLLAVLREHPQFQDPARGNVNAVSPIALAAFFAESGRHDQWNAFLVSQKGDAHADLAIGEAGFLALNGKFDAARAVIDRHIRPSRPDSAARLEAALRGEVVLPPPSPRKEPPIPNPPPEESRLRQMQEDVAMGHAVQGDVEKAGQMKIALERDASYYPAGKGRLAAHEWSRFAMLAAEHHHFDAARRGFDLANNVMQYDGLVVQEHREEKARLVREAVGLGQYEIANSMHQTSSRPGGWTRLSLVNVYLKRGDAAKAAKLLDEALAIAYEPDSKEGASMAMIAVELDRMGKPDRAERVFLDSMTRIHGEDFGFSGTSSIVEAAVAMKRVDLLDRLYDRGDGGDRLLLCIMASRQSMLSSAQAK
jgi:tetratricopeptide (TPR) repeat protein